MFYPLKNRELKYKCPFHFLVHLDKNEEFQVNTSCESLQNIIHKSSFILPPLMAFYYKKKHPFYKVLSPFRNDCFGESVSKMDFIYPKENTTFYLTKNFKEEKKGFVLKLIHSNPSLKVFWYLDRLFIGSTQNIHEFEVLPSKGKHLITAIDELGNEINRETEILD